jgi:6-phosphogluconolactonase (cycloisomerase 2 family)
MIKLLITSLLIGIASPYWGHTFIAEGNGKIYALRSLDNSSSLCVFDAKILGDDEFFCVTDDVAPKALTEVTTPGKHSCHIVLLERQAVVADYTSGTLTLYELDGQGLPQPNPTVVKYEGKGPHPKRQLSPHIHSSTLSPDGKTLLVADLGCDRLIRYNVENGRLVLPEAEIIALPAGSGPRHCAFAPEGDYLYVVTELTDEVMTFRTSDYKLLNRYVLNAGNPEGGAHIVVSADGKYLYASSRVSRTSKASSQPIPDGIAIYKRLADGKLKQLHYQPTGAHPRHFAVSSDGTKLVVACRDSNSVETYTLKGGVPVGRAETKVVSQPVYVRLK